ALWYLLSLQRAGTGAFAHGDPLTTILLVGAGIVTAGPLILFAYGAQRVTMTTLGILQYMAPTLQFLLGVFVYREAFSTARLAGFAVIWLALAVYTGEGYLNRKRRQAQPASG
ncbi:MAG: EamA family transporter, partial [Anaerolineae bacterium]